jgi:hypothetical protein
MLSSHEGLASLVLSGTYFAPHLFLVHQHALCSILSNVESRITQMDYLLKRSDEPGEPPPSKVRAILLARYPVSRAGAPNNPTSTTSTRGSCSAQSRTLIRTCVGRVEPASQYDHEWAARLGEDHAGAQDAGHTAPAHHGGAHRGPQGPQRERGRQRGARHAQAVPGAASYRIDLRVGRGWEQPAARGGVAGAPRCALPRRVARVQPESTRGLAPAPGGWSRDDLAGRRDTQLSCAGHATLFHEPLSLRLHRGQEEGLPVHGRPDRTLPGPNLRAIARSHGSLRRRAAPYAPGAVRREGPKSLGS